LGEIVSRPTQQITAMWSRKIQFGQAVLAITCAMLVTRFNEVDVPLMRILRGKNAVDPRQLHLHGEFVESNLGSGKSPMALLRCV
jgi:hypothetical protein